MSFANPLGNKVQSVLSGYSAKFGEDSNPSSRIFVNNTNTPNITANNLQTVIEQIDNTISNPVDTYNIIHISKEADLPTPVGGKITLNDSTVYYFHGFTTSVNTLVMGNSTVLLGSHASVDGFIHLGTSNAIEATNVSFFIINLYVHAPGGTIFSVSGTTINEFIHDSAAFSDAAGLGNIASLGTITGFRTPSFKGCNFEDFDAGLTFDGTINKIFIDGTPFRNVNTAGVSIITLASTLSVELVDLTNNFFKDVLADTIIINGEVGSLPSEIFQYRGNMHDSTVTVANILVGDVNEDNKGVNITDSYPIANSVVQGSIRTTASGTIVGSGGASTQITLPTNLITSQRTLSPSNGILEYNSRVIRLLPVSVTVTVSGASTDRFDVLIGLNGSTAGRTIVSGATFNANSTTSITNVESILLSEGDQLSVFIENVDGASDLIVDSMTLTI